MIEILSNPSVKRAIVGAITALLVVLNEKLGLDLGMIDVTALVTLALGFITQSAVKEVKMAGVDAAAAIKSKEDAMVVINGGKP